MNSGNNELLKLNVATSKYIQVIFLLFLTKDANEYRIEFEEDCLKYCSYTHKIESTSNKIS
ncbi:MAG TPA: hypothetical protein VFK40_13515 [Nitrososphaeraceae archaeon]|nr:hypothetical protein [Nitrososphaeraceae archaeon]